MNQEALEALDSILKTLRELQKQRRIEPARETIKEQAHRQGMIYTLSVVIAIIERRMGR